MRGLFSIRRAIFVGTVAAFLLPISFSSGEGVSSNDACASGGCCSEWGSVCGELDNARYILAGCYKRSD